MKKVLVSALEPSSNLHLEMLSVYLKDVQLCGIFDRKLGDCLYSPQDLSVMGFVDVLKKILFFKKVFAQMLDLVRDADIVLLMDSSSFNIPFAKKVKQLYPQKQIIYYILPQVWAWKPWRAKSIEKYCDRLAGILPFEISYYKSKAVYVGNPLLDELKMIKSSPNRNGPIAYMPGSRIGEIRRIFPTFVQVARQIEGDRILIVPHSFKDLNLYEIYGSDIELFNICFDANKGLFDAKFAFICSGTATLQSALIGTPFVLCYRAKKIDEFVVRLFLKIKYVGLANILFNASGESGELHRELIQDDFNVENLIGEYENFDINSFFEKTKKLSEYLKQGSSKEVASWINDIEV